jgi:hypothetical protein
MYMTTPKFDVNLLEIALYDYRRNPYGNIVFPSLQELLDFLGKFNTTGCFFRGQTGLWDVVSSLHRHRDENFKKACNISISALEWLKNNKYISTATQNNDDYLFAIAQHYGCPTDLVDITTDYRTAAYFASSNNVDHEKTPEGCVWVFPTEEIERLRDLMETPPEGLLEQLPKGLMDKFIENNRSPLIQLNIPQLSRLNAQSGAFLWDMAGILKLQLYFACIGTRFVFKHTQDEKSIFIKDEGRLFPFPNQLESEIMRIFKERSRFDGLPEYYGIIGNVISEKEGLLKNGLPSRIVDNAKGTVFVPLPDNFTPSFGEYEWIQQTVSQDRYDIKNIDMTNYLECHLPFSVKGTLSLVQHILKSVSDNSLTDLLILFYREGSLLAVHDGDEEILIDIVITLSNYSYSDCEIAEVLLEWLKMLTFKSENGFIPKTEAEFELALNYGYVNDLVSKYYGCRVTKLNLGEGDGMTRFWLPENYNFLEKEYQAEFLAFDKSYLEMPAIFRDYCEKITDNSQIFLHQHKPKKIMPYDTMKKMFVELILPQHFAFRRIGEKIYIPDYIDKISLPIFGRTMYGITDAISSEDACRVFYMA